jgi:transposase
VSLVAKWNKLNTKTLEKQYKEHLSGFRWWIHLDHCEDWLLFPENLGPKLSIDEVSLSNGELYTVVTNKSAKGRKGTLVAIIKGTKASVVSDILIKISMNERVKVLEVTLDMADTMDWIVRECFPNARKVTDRFHAQQLVSEALQDMRIRERWKAIDEENEAIQQARKSGQAYRPLTYSNGDTKKQLLARGRYLLYKPQSKWSDSQKERAAILFREFPELKEGYDLSMVFRSFYEDSKTRETAKEKLNGWYRKVEEKDFKSFATAAQSIQNHEGWILNYFPERSTNASAESFNAKLKGFRSIVQGVTDKKFFLFRITKLYA